MEQTITRSAFNFVPKPIEQQIAAQQLGALLDVYQWGWKRSPIGDRRPSKLLPLVGAIGGVIGTLASIIVIEEAIRTTGLIVFSMFFLPIITAMIAIVGILALLRSSLCVAAFSEAFVYANGTHVTVLRWHEVVSCERELLKTKYIYTIRAKNGKILTWKVDYRLMQNLAKIIDEHIGR